MTKDLVAGFGNDTSGVVVDFSSKHPPGVFGLYRFGYGGDRITIFNSCNSSADLLKGVLGHELKHHVCQYHNESYCVGHFRRILYGEFRS